MSHFDGLACILLLLVLFISEFMCKRLRIVGGYKCNINKNPFMVSIRVEDPNEKNNYIHYCGGTIVNKKWVLSAAHCYIGEELHIDVDDYLVVAGISKQSEFLHKNAQKRKVKTIVTEEYDNDTHNNDIALLKLKIPLTKTETVQFVTLPKVSIFPTDISEKYKMCTAMGWGMTAKVDSNGTISLTNTDDVDPDHLMCVELPLIEFNKCQNIFHDLGPNKITNNQICTLHPDPKGGKDACEGDSGGPLICGGLQHGITSWGLGCAQPGVPGVFTRVDKYIDWIKSITEEPPADNITRNDVTCNDTTWNDVTSDDKTWGDTTWNDVTSDDITWDATTWNDVTSDGITWDDTTREDTTWYDVTLDDALWNTMELDRNMELDGTSNNSLENSVTLLLIFSNLLSIWKCTCCLN